MMKQDSRTEVLAGVGQAQDPHRSLHSETRARPGEHPGRSGNPLVKVAGLAWLEFDGSICAVSDGEIEAF